MRSKNFVSAKSERQEHKDRKPSSRMVDRPLRRAMLDNRGSAALTFGIELATGRVRPLADKGLLDPPYALQDYA